jgi:hypothetical protein
MVSPGYNPWLSMLPNGCMHFVDTINKDYNYINLK